MNAKQWAKKLNGRQYGEEFSDEEEEQLDEDGVAVFIGASDDLIEIYGALGRIEQYDHEVCMSKEGVYERECSDDSCPFEQRIKDAITSKVQYHCNQKGYSWFIESNVKFWPFDIMEDGEKYCRGIAIDVKDIK